MRISHPIVVVAIGLLWYGQLAFGLDDQEYWSQFEVVGSIAEKLDFKVKPELRYNNDASDLYYLHFETGVDWKVNSWLVLAPYYRHVNEKKRGIWSVEFRPHLNATFIREFWGINFSDRNRIEYRGRESTQSFRYRNRFMAKLPKYTKFRIQPYIAEEPFYDFDEKKWNKNRGYIGVDFPVIRSLKGGLFFIYESRSNNNKWTGVGVLGTSLTYKY